MQEKVKSFYSQIEVMGLDLKPFVMPSPIVISELANKVIAVDAHNAIYQFLATIRGPIGELLTNNKGDVTSHLSGLFYRNINLLADNLKLIYIFDGKPSLLKSKEIERRRQAKEEASQKYQEAMTEGRFEDARKYSQATSILTDKMIEESKKILNLLGIPYIQAPSEGEATAAHLTKSDLAYTCASQDYDSILFGAKRLTRNLAISGKRKVPNRNMYVEVQIEMIEHQQVLDQTKLTQEQLIDVGILIGTDFNPGGVPGIGPKTGLKLIREYGKLENVEKIKDTLSGIPYQEIRDIFLRPAVSNADNVEFTEVRHEDIINFLCIEKNFSTDRVTGSLEKLKKSIAQRSQSLEKWF
ncbi:MAG: flap endonuclease-1 [Candidatus Nitrosopolaris sp.]